MKSDEINQLHRKKPIDFYKSWLDYNYNGTHPEPSGNRNHRPTEYRQPISFEQYVSMKKERRLPWPGHDPATENGVRPGAWRPLIAAAHGHPD